MSKTPDQSTEQPAYQVLARKYRPATFDELIGQQAMVQTLQNAFKLGRIAQGFMLTGVRGVGKTTTARILARALNYESDGIDEPSIDMPALGAHCQAIMESRHVDILEMDAASHTGVDDIREIIESTRYKPISARYKVYIIDEVHMLSKSAFNALLKTLEEPPEHVKFIFATTEINKVPVTVLSRCQRFDLKRVEMEQLVAHFAGISKKEGVSVEEDALGLIARAAEGSVRDGLSILDQAIAHASDKVTSDDVRAMLGLADRLRIFDLLDSLMQGDAAAALTQCEGLHKDGAEPSRILTDLAETAHIITRRKVLQDAGSRALSEGERTRAAAMAEKLSMPVLSRCWQMLIKGIDECSRAPNQIAAVEMVLVRIAYAADLPSPEELARLIKNQGQGQQYASGAAVSAAPPAAGSAGDGAAMHPNAPGSGDGPVHAPPSMSATAVQLAPASYDASGPVINSFEDVAEIIGRQSGLMLKLAFEESVRPVALEPGSLEIALADDAPKGLANDLKRVLHEATGVNWMVVVSQEKGGETLSEKRRRQHEENLAQVQQHPLVKAALKQFPDARITDIRPAGDKTDKESER